MFCPNCGSNIPDSSRSCRHCGVATEPLAPPAGRSSSVYCRNCGSQIAAAAVVCVHCGVETRTEDPLTRALHPQGGRSWVVTLLLCLCAPLMGLHRFYTGDILIGVLQLITGGGCTLWWLFDLILILTDGYRDAEGQPLVR